MNPPARVIIAGGTGFLGQVLSAHLSQRGWEVIVLTRCPASAPGPVRYVGWDGRTEGDWCRLLEGAQAAVNLAGRSVDCRYHARNRRLILDSRLESTRVLGAAIARCAEPPPVWLNASTATIYRHTFGPPWDETGEIGAHPDAKDAFSIEVAQAWERELEQANVPRTRKVALRTAMVLGLGRNSVFPVLRRLARLGLGGALAGGRQFVSWIHELDFCRAIEWLFTHDDLSGVVNVAAPNPVTNAELMRLVRRECGALFGLPAPRWLLELGAFFLRTETELVIKSRRVVPGRLLRSGFQFSFPELAGAIHELHTRPA